MRGLIGRYLLPAYIVMVSAYNAANELIKDGDLKKQLTNEEWNKLIGNDDGNFTIAYVPLDFLSSNSSNHKLQIETPRFGQNFNLDIAPSSKLISTDFVVLETYANESIPYQFKDEDIRCFYRGTNTALSLCQGLNGILQTNEDHYYLIHPLPKRFRNTAQIPHLVIKKPHDLYKNKDYYKLKEKLDKLANIKNSINKKYYDFDKENKQSNESAVHMVDLRSSNSLLKLASNNKEKWYSPAKIKEPKFIQRKINRKLKRAKREAFPAGATVFVETAVFVDRDLFEHMKTNFPVDTEREIIRFVLAMVNAVQLLYHDSSLGRPVNFVLKRLEIMKDEVTGLARPPDIDRFLSNFCNWQRTKNPAGDREPLHWDHALILTGLDLYVRGKHGKISNQVVGTHIPMLPPKDGYRDFVNRKGWPSMVLQCVVDDYYRFRDISIKFPGASHDAVVFRDSKLCRRADEVLPSKAKEIDGKMIPLMLVGDPAYPLLPWLLKPYTGVLSAEEESFNCYLSSARIIVENTIGRLKARWRCIQKRVDVKHTFVPHLVSACCVLHNIVETNKDTFIAQWMEAVHEADLLFPQPSMLPIQSTPLENSKDIRDHLKNYMSKNFVIRQSIRRHI